MKNKRFLRYLSIIGIIVFLISIAGCAMFRNEVKKFKGELIGNNFTINMYDDFGNKTLTLYGDKVGLEGNYISSTSKDSEGNTTTNYELSSVITLTIDGHTGKTTGSTIIFAEEGLNKLEDFEIPNEISTSGGTINLVDRNINKLKNILGTSKIVVVCSELGIPLAIYGGDSVYEEISQDLPKTTLVNIDGKALYIHRADLSIWETAMIPE